MKERSPAPRSTNGEMDSELIDSFTHRQMGPLHFLTIASTLLHFKNTIQLFDKKSADYLKIIGHKY